GCILMATLGAFFPVGDVLAVLADDDGSLESDRSSQVHPHWRRSGWFLNGDGFVYFGRLRGRPGSGRQGGQALVAELAFHVRLRRRCFIRRWRQENVRLSV